ncbi:glycosyltransferase family 2 protein [Microbacterium sp.]|uniref:glycosyltransferase family 2 protein n=1 Tax=Microbacterium sp. TaxID=51671 RepID=UPI003736EE16
MLKVSVIIPTYQTPQDGLAGLIASLDAQTMSRRDFEVIFVDDGSPDDTVTRLREVARTRPHISVEVIENSGWPSRPRNVGIDKARGEFVAFMDHDDQIYPDGLRAAYEFAVANGSDVVNGKESRTDAPAWGIGVYEADDAQVIGSTARHPLLPMNPHKLYRRRFLLENGIRFPEGRRVLWEDIFFNLQVSRDAKVISTLSSVPYYHWVTTEGSGSTTFIKSADDYWHWLRRVCEETDSVLAGEEHRLQREQLNYHQYSTRIVGVFDLAYTKRSERNRKFIFDHSRSLQQDFGYSRLDDRLPSSRRIRAHLLETGRQDLMETVCSADAAVPGWGRARAIQWREGVLHIEADVQWSDSAGRVPALVRSGERIVKALPEEVAAAIPEALADVTDEIAAVELGMFVHGRRSRVAWSLPATGTVTTEDAEDGTVTMSASVSGTLDPMTAAFGAPLDTATHWDINIHTRFGSGATDRSMRTDIPASATITQNRLHLIYPNDGGSATLIPGGQREAVRRLAPVSVDVRHRGGLRLVLSGTHDGQGAVDTVVGVWDEGKNTFTDRPATISLDADGTAHLQIAGLHGESAEIRVGDRTPGGPAAWIVRLDGTDTTPRRSTREKPAAAPSAAPTAVPPPTPAPLPLWKRARRKVGRVLRRWGLR